MRSVAQLASDACDYTFNTEISLRSWLHVARSVLREAQIYQLEGDLESAYVLHLRYADLVLNRLPHHPDVTNAVLAPLSMDVKNVIAMAEQIRKQLEARPKTASITPAKAMPSSKDHQSNNSMKTMPSQPDLPGRPLKLQDIVYPPAPFTQTPFEGRSLPDQPHLNARSSSLSPIPQSSTTPNFGETLSALRRSPNAVTIPPSLSPPGHSTSNLSNNTYASLLPAQYTQSSHNQQSVHPLPALPHDAFRPVHSASGAAAISSTAEHRASATTEGGSPLRTLFVPEQLRSTFLQFASKNTLNNLETAGVLCGRLSRNAFFVTHLVIPPQESTSDTCATTDEEKLFCYLDERDLFVLGWIHTHPTQSCFLSSIDLHTQFSYQTMLPEAVAVVCSPRREPSWGAFRLTDPRGIGIIKKCPRSGFHPHPESDLYRKALPGHMRLLNTSFETADLRS